MRDYLPFIVTGLVSGSIYGMAGLGLVLTYRTSGVFNFAHGALAAAGAYVFHQCHNLWGWPWPVAAAVSIFAFGTLAGAATERMARRLSGARTATITVATVGLMLFIQGMLPQIFGVERQQFPEFLPRGTVFTVSGVAVSWAELIKLGIGFAAFCTLTLFLRRTRLGLAMRAIVADGDLLGLSGTEPARVRVASWVIGAWVASLTGVLIAPVVGLDLVVLVALVVQAFGAVAVGGFRSLSLTYLGGLLIGVMAAFSTKWWGARPPLNGIASIVPFLVLIFVMLALGRKLPAGAGRLSGKVATARSLPAGVTRLGAGVAVIGLVAVPQLVGVRLPVYTTGLVFALLFLSLSLLTGVSGQISLGHAALAGVGAVAFSNLTVKSGMPWLPALIVAGLITAAVGALLALPAMRLSGLYLALATYGFGLLMDLVVFKTWLLFGSSNVTGAEGRRPVLGSLLRPGNDKAYYYVVLAVVVVSALLLLALQRARLGRYLRAMADSSAGLQTSGLSVNVTRTLVFTVSAFFAGIAGALYLGQIRLISPVSFNANYSLLYLAVFVVASAIPGFVVPAFAAAGALVVLPSYMTSMTLDVQMALFGGVAVLVAVLSDGAVRWADLGARMSAALRRAIDESDFRREKSPLRSRRTPEPVQPTGGVR